MLVHDACCTLLLCSLGFCIADSQMSTALIGQSYDNNVYGAASFRQADSSDGTYDYTVHVRGRQRERGGGCLFGCLAAIHL